MNILFALLIGGLGGLVASLCGVGGGIIMVPAFVLALGLDQKPAVATSLAVIAPTALMAMARFQGHGLIQWKLVIPTAVGAVLVAFFAADWMRSLSNPTLTRIFAVVLIGVGIRMLFTRT